MKAEELRIGNWINEEDWKSGRDIRINGDAIQALYESQRKFTTHLYRSWKPVPLSESWLLKLGFEYSINWEIEIYERTYLSISLYDNGNFRASLSWDNTIRLFKGDLKYVHELQNLYHAITGKELVASI